MKKIAICVGTLIFVSTFASLSTAQLPGAPKDRACAGIIWLPDGVVFQEGLPFGFAQGDGENGYTGFFFPAEDVATGAFLGVGQIDYTIECETDAVSMAFALVPCLGDLDPSPRTNLACFLGLRFVADGDSALAAAIVEAVESYEPPVPA